MRGGPIVMFVHQMDYQMVYITHTHSWSMCVLIIMKTRTLPKKNPNCSQPRCLEINHHNSDALTWTIYSNAIPNHLFLARGVAHVIQIQGWGAVEGTRFVEAGGSQTFSRLQVPAPGEVVGGA